MTLCLKDTGKLTDEHALDNDLYIILPIKPTKGYNKFSADGVSEADNTTNRVIAGQGGYID